MNDNAKKPINSHYVPQQTLKRFSQKLSLFNIHTGEFKEEVPVKNAFSEIGFYSNEIEDKLNKRIETQFGALFNDNIAKTEGSVELSLKELRIVKKFLLISVIRSYGYKEFMEQERHFYETLQKSWLQFAKTKGISEEDAKKNMPKAPFEEKQIEGETPFDYWMRTLDVILSSDGTPESILKYPDKTYPAYRWAQVINNGYLAFWDSDFVSNEFVITDVGMTSENEKGWDGIAMHNRKKTDFLLGLLENEKDERMKIEIARYLKLHSNFSENFMMFPISAKRMIVEIDPFYKFRTLFSRYFRMPRLDELTEMANEDLFRPNECKYYLPQDGLNPKHHPNDKYIYKIHKLTGEETVYCNNLFLDRINTNVGFSSLGKVVRSVLRYKKRNSLPFKPRVDYTKLYELINERFQANIDLSTIIKP